MDDVITSLDDATAKRVLVAIAQGRLSDGDVQTELTPELVEALQDAFAAGDSPGEAIAAPGSGDPSPGSAAGSSGPASDGDLARDALAVLVDEDPQVTEHIEALAEAPPTRSFSLVGAVALTTAALLVLQTHVRVERTETGDWSVLVEKKPTKDRLLTTLAQKLVALYSGGPTKPPV